LDNATLALGIVCDGDILQYICYDLEDQEMIDVLRPSFIQAREIKTQEKALNYIGTRGDTMGSVLEKRIR